MSILLNYLELMVGSLLIYKTAKIVFNQAVKTINHSRLTIAFLGIIILPLITGFPNLFVSLVSIFRGIPDIAYLNNIGNNIGNLTIAFGFAALVTSSYAVNGRKIIRRDALFLLISSLVAVFLMADGRLSRYDGLILIAMFLLYIFRFVKDEMIEMGKKNSSSHNQAVTKMLLTVVVAGIVMYLSAELIILGAKGLISSTPLSQNFVGAVLVGMATVLPNASIIIYASYKANHDLSFGNLMGDSIVSIPLILGIVALIHPLTIAAKSMFLLPTLAVITLLFFSLVYRNHMNKIKALLMILIYFIVVYKAFIL